MKTRIDLSAENFDLLFAREIENISPEAKDSLPDDISFKIFRKGGEFDSKSTSRLSFVEKLFVLWKARNKKYWIVVEDQQNGISVDQFLQLRNSYKKRDYSIDRAEEPAFTGTFVLASKELGEAFEYLNRLCNSPAYNYLIKGKNKASTPAADWAKKMDYIVKFISCYEANKKGWVATTGVSIPEWLVLIYLYHRGEAAGAPIHKEFYKRAYQSSPYKLQKCFAVLQHKGFISKTGESKGAKLSITPLGKDTVNTILTKYALDC